jgi:hypothetical protein
VKPKETEFTIRSPNNRPKRNNNGKAYIKRGADGEVERRQEHKCSNIMV